jgi:chromosome condensin MukBEF ATPase and DNA-binding subunit MukB
MSHRDPELRQRIHELETQVRHLGNELRLTKEEYEDASSKYLDMYCKLDKKVSERTSELDAANRRLVQEIEERKHTEAEKEQLIAQLQKAMQDVKVLSGFLPICASCKKIRDDTGYWRQIEEYISTHSSALFSHGICPDCAKKLYPGFHEELQGSVKK